jgi:predicted protein tyrosine phosphatase
MTSPLDDASDAAADRRTAKRLHVLFVCALNQWRSPTAEHLYRNDARLEVRSAGVRAQARRRVTERDLAWADVVFTMDREQKQWILREFRDAPLPPIVELDIPDNYMYMDTRLQEALRQAIDPELEAWCRNGGLSG